MDRGRFRRTEDGPAAFHIAERPIDADRCVLKIDAAAIEAGELTESKARCGGSPDESPEPGQTRYWNLGQQVSAGVTFASN